MFECSKFFFAHPALDTLLCGLVLSHDHIAVICFLNNGFLCMRLIFVAFAFKLWCCGNEKLLLRYCGIMDSKSPGFTSLTHMSDRSI